MVTKEESVTRRQGMCVGINVFKVHYNLTGGQTTMWKLKNIFLNLEPVPGIEIVVSVKIKIAAVECLSLQFSPPPPQKK